MTKQQLESIFNLQIEIAVNSLKNGYDPEKIILYGSVARGDFNENSDIDLIVIKKGVDNVRPLYRIREALSFTRDAAKVEPLVYSPEEIKSIEDDNFFLREAISTGKVIYEK